MIIEQANYVEGYKIDDAWRDVMWLCVRKGYDIVVKKGSYVGEIRRQLPHAMIRILNVGVPEVDSLAPILPPSCPAPTDDEHIKNYFYNLLINPEVSENQQYTYGSFIVPQLPKIIDILLQGKGNTNQATITIGDRNSVNLDDPPCMKVINFKIVYGRLNMSVLFRSWDLVAGMPENLGGLQWLKHYVLACLASLNVADGELIAFSDGLHIYEHNFAISDMLCVDKIKISTEILKEQEDFKRQLEEVK